MLLLVGVVAAVMFDAATKGVMRLFQVPRHLALALVLLLAAAGGGVAVWWGGSVLAQQFGGYIDALGGLLTRASEDLSRIGIHLGSDRIDLTEWIPAPATLFGNVASVVQATIGAVIILFLGAFFAWEPPIYKVVVLSILPLDKRQRVDEVLDKAGSAMRNWMLGQAVSMVVVFVFTLVALLMVGMPYAAVLAVIAGLLTFIPTAGPFLAGIAIVLAGLSQGLTMAAYGLGVYLVAQFLETHLVTPMVQEQTVRLPPAITLGAQLVFGALFGFLGFAFAVPIAAAGRVLVEELYVNDQLGGPWSKPTGSQTERD